ncbi:MAG: hypothetical protein P1U56_15740 [Saprospiraceae bacterium]|nr:hypothetical protein [Saprospiraceae bacterium]
MKNIFLPIILVFCFAFVGNSQVRFGAGITYLNEVGVQARSIIALENFDLIPKFSYYIIDDVTSISFEVDAAYTAVTVGDDVPVYLFGGPALYRSSRNGISDSNFGITIGAGTEISRIYGELKYTNLFCTGCEGQIGFAVGYMF